MPFGVKLPSNNASDVCMWGGPAGGGRRAFERRNVCQVFWGERGVHHRDIGKVKIRKTEASEVKI